jgi:hypothetical protein
MKKSGTGRFLSRNSRVKTAELCRRQAVFSSVEEHNFGVPKLLI